MSRDSNRLSSELYDVMRNVVEHDFAIEHCRELLNAISKSTTEVAALAEHIRRHEVQRLKALVWLLAFNRNSNPSKNFDVPLFAPYLMRIGRPRSTRSKRYST